MITVRTVYDMIDAAAPFETQLDYDNSGLLFGGMDRPVTGIIVGLDLSGALLDEAEAAGCNLIVTHHPVMFQPVRRLLDSDPEQRLILRAIRLGMSMIAAHTCFDLCASGTNDTLAALLGLEDVEASEFIRVGSLPEPLPAEAFRRQLEERLGDRARLMGNPDRLIRRVGLCTGAGSEFWPEALALGADAFLSGEIRHHHALAASASGLTLFECGHHVTEEPGIFALADALQKQLDALQWKGCVVKASVGAYPWKA